MKNTILSLTVLAGLAIANQAQAQIGWTLEQCEAAYSGKPAETNVVEHHGLTGNLPAIDSHVEAHHSRVRFANKGTRFRNQPVTST